MTLLIEDFETDELLNEQINRIINIDSNKNDLIASKMEKDSDHFKSVKTTLNSLRVDNSRLSSSVLEIIENKIVPYWQVVKANVANFSNFFLIYVLEAEPTEEIPLLLTDAFYDRCILN